MRPNETTRRWLASAGLVITLAAVATYVALNIATIRAGGATVLDAFALNQLVLGVMYGLANRLRDATDLGAIGTDVVTAVDRSLRPAHHALWVRRTTG